MSSLSSYIVIVLKWLGHMHLGSIINLIFIEGNRVRDKGNIEDCVTSLMDDPLPLMLVSHSAAVTTSVKMRERQIGRSRT